MSHTAPTRPRRHTGLWLLLAGLGFAAVGTFLWAVMAFWFYTDCPGYDDEGIIAAPESPQGRVLCNDTGAVAQHYVFALMVLLAVATVVIWLRKRAVVPTLLLMAVTALLPVPATALVYALPDECTSAQWDTYGDEGCQTDLEQ